jgi:hypothetical protein
MKDKRWGKSINLQSVKAEQEINNALKQAKYLESTEPYPNSRFALRNFSHCVQSLQELDFALRSLLYSLSFLCCCWKLHEHGLEAEDWSSTIASHF